MRALFMSASAVALLVATPALAQEASAEPASLDEIVVTAQKRSERLQEVPVSVTAVTGEQLAKQGLTAPGDLATQVPNLQVNDVLGSGAPVFALRGVSMSDYSLNQSSPVASYVDDVYKGNFALFGVSMYDVERVEVLRGPQGTLYGKNTTGGAINFNTRKPGFETEGYLTAGLGNYGHRSLDGAVQAGLSDTVAARLAFTAAEADGWFENRTGPDKNAVREYGVRGSLLWRPTDALEFVLRASTSEQSPWNYGIAAVPGPNGIGGGAYALFNSIDPLTNPNVDDFRTGLGRRELESDYNERRRNGTSGVSLTADWDVTEALSLTSVTSWDKGDLSIPEDTDGSALKVIEILYESEAEQVSQDLRLTSDFDGPFNFILGAYWGRETVFNATDMGFFQDIDVNFDGSLDFLDCVDSAATIGSPGQIFPIGCRARNAFDQERTSTALYTDVSYDLTERVKLRGGLRYSRDKGDLTGFRAQLVGSDGVVLANLIPGDPLDVDVTTSRAFSDGQVTGKLGLDYKTASGKLLYASYSRGYRSGAFNAQAFFDPSELTVTEPETIDAVEAGFKSRWLDERLQLNGAVFEYRYQNQQVIDVDPAMATQLLVNIPRSRVRGAELELLARPADAVTVSAGLGLLDSEVEEATLRGLDISGNDLPQAPTTTLTAAVDWQVVERDWGSVSLHVDGSYVSSQFFEIMNVDRLQQDGYGLLNARLGVSSADGRWEAAVWVKNLADTDYFTSAIDLQATAGLDYHHLGAPRTFGVTLDRRF